MLDPYRSTTVGEEHRARYWRELGQWRLLCSCGFRAEAASRSEVTSMQRAHVTEARLVVIDCCDDANG